MKEYIEREAALQSCCNHSIPILVDGKPTFEVDYIFAINAVPTADVRENVRGEWVSKEYMCGDPSVGIEDAWIDRLAEQSDYYAYCSVCGKNAGYNAEQSLILSDFCPNCGADMTKEATK